MGTHDLLTGLPLASRGPPMEHPWEPHAPRMVPCGVPRGAS